MRVPDKHSASFSHARKFMIASAILLCAVQTFPFASALADAIQLTAIQSSNVQGHLFPCPT